MVLDDLKENALYDVTIVRRTAGKQTMVGPLTIRALDPPRQVSSGLFRQQSTQARGVPVQIQLLRRSQQAMQLVQSRNHS